MIEIAYVSKLRNLKVVKKKLAQAQVIGVDVETTGLDALTDKIVLIQLATVEETFVLDMFKLPTKAVGEILDTLLHDEHKVKVLHNAKFDLKFIQQTFGFGLNATNVFDTMLAHSLIHGGDKSFRSALDAVCLEVMGLELDKTEQVGGWGKHSLYKEQIQYAGLDAYVLLPLYQKLTTSLKTNNLLRVAKLEFECIPAIASMELNGIKLDRQVWTDVALKDKDRMFDLQEQVRDILDDPLLNLKSSPQMCRKLTEISGYQIKSIAKDKIQWLIDNYEVRTDLFGNKRDIRPILLKYQEWADYKKLQTSFGLNFLKFIHPKTGRVHPSFWQNGTNTGRFSCSEPNMQQIPKTPEHRGAFVAEEGNVLITKDYSQIELRILADITGEDTLVQAFTDGRDIHTEVAMQITGKEAEGITKDERNFAKIINYGTPYGMGASRMATLLKIPYEQAQRVKRDYMRANPAIADWFKKQEDYFRTYLCVRTASGRLRKLNKWFIDDDSTFHAVQASKNFPIQGTNADIMKTALTGLYRQLPAEAMLVNCVHDEVVVECNEKHANGISELIDDIMISAGEEFVKSVPVLVDGKINKSWSK